jgi:hypothetical protein
MEIIKGIEIIDLCLYIKKHKTLVISDLHLGYEEAMNQRGVLVPKTQFKDVYEKLEKILKSIIVETVIITGDLKHEFGTIGDAERKNILSLIDMLLKDGKKVVLLKGNHDIMLPFIARKRNIEIIESLKIEDILICHGDEILPEAESQETRVIIMGHEHPAIGLREKAKYESYKCFLKGKFKNKILIVIPSFNPLTVGTDVLRNNLLSPFLKQDLNKFEAFIVEKEKIYNFGKLNKINLKK